MSLKKFQVSAPGKVILHGEHSVVYGKPALAGVVGVRNYMRFIELDNDTITILFPKLGLDFSIELKEINDLLKASWVQYGDKKLPENINHDEFFNSMKSLVDKRNLNEREIFAVSAAFYLLIGILIDNQIKTISKGFKIDLLSEISIGAGLGSSASFGVCLAATFYVYSQLYKTELFLSSYNNLNEDQKQSIKRYIADWAFLSEKIMHGNPSGLDNTICTFGNIVKFYKGINPIEVKLSCPLPILLVDTLVSRSTAKLVAKVADLKSDHPKMVNSIFDAMGYLVEDAVEILEKIGFDDTENYRKLEKLVTINNNLLRSIGVSHPSLEKIFEISEKYGFSSKLSGAGGGGFAMILLPSNFNELENYKLLCEELKNLKFDLIETTLGGKGVEFMEF